MTPRKQTDNEFPHSPAANSTVVPQDIVQEVEAEQAARTARLAAQEPFSDRFVWSILFKIIAAVAIAVAGAFVIYQTRHLLGMLVVSTFFALAMIPGVNALVRRWGISRGAAVGIIYLIAVVGVGLMIGLLLPAMVKFAEQVGAEVSGWINELNTWATDTLGAPAFDDAQAPSDAINTFMYGLAQWGDNVLGFISSGLGLIFDIFTMAAFTFYIAADFPKLMRTFMRRMPPARQRIFWWIADQSIEQTGGYFYSRMLLMIVNGSLGFVIMVVLGLPVLYALPLALFMGFVSEFIPFIGTYIGAAIPILILLAVQGPGAALIMTVYIIIYQQAENYWLSPKFSSQTMELNGALAFGAAIAGGAIAGPMGAFMALPMAALCTAIITNTGKTYELVETANAATRAAEADAAAKAAQEESEDGFTDKVRRALRIKSKSGD